MSMRPARWIRLTIAVALGLMLLSAGLNYAVNPYGIFEHAELPGMTGTRNRTASDRMTKFYYARRLNPEVLVLGSSRLGVIRPAMLSPYVEGRAYNLYLNGVSANHMRRYLEYFAANHPVRTVLLGADFFSFNPARYEPGARAQDTFTVDRLKRGVYFQDYLVALASRDTLVRSVKTWLDNVKGKVRRFDFEEGSITWESEQREFERGGVAYVEGRMEGTLRDFASDDEIFDSRAFAEPDSVERGLEHVEAIVRLCAERDIALSIFISPINARHLDLIYARGLGATFEHWKARMVEIAGPMYDFTVKSGISRDSNWWYDSSHIQRKAAPLMLGRIFGNTEMDIPADFGVLLSPETVGEVNRAVRESIEPMDLSRFRP